jgi:hypothetical protein
VIGQFFVVIVNFEKYLLTFCLERSKVVFLVRVVGVAKIIVDRDGFDYALNSFLAKGSNAGRDRPTRDLFTTARDGRFRAANIRLGPRADADCRYRRRCTAGWSAATGAQPGPERPATSHQFDGPTALP